MEDTSAEEADDDEEGAIEEEDESAAEDEDEINGAAEEIGRTGEEEGVARPEEAVIVADSNEELKADMFSDPLEFAFWLIEEACPGRQTNVHPDASTWSGT